MGSENTVVHLLAGGLGGTAGAVITCPLEVVKTRLQSSVAQFGNAQFNGSKPVCIPGRRNMSTCVTATTQTAHNTSIANTRISAGLWTCLKHIVQHEGPRGLFKGLGPNLVGVAPSRAIYFCAYDSAKRFFNNVFVTESPSVHICSAAFAGFTASTTTNPIWFIKTRLQLDQKRSGSLTVTQCIRTTFAESGIRGFYKGITASYYGISETVIHFVIYEAIKAHLREQKAYNGHSEEKGTIDFIEFMGAGAVSKTIATCVAYPHEVARTRLRQSGDKYHRFWQTLAVVLKEEGVRGLYRGLATQLVRQIPNTAIMMSTYEAVVYLCSRQLLEIDPDDDY